MSLQTRITLIVSLGVCILILTNCIQSTPSSVGRVQRQSHNHHHHHHHDPGTLKGDGSSTEESSMGSLSANTCRNGMIYDANRGCVFPGNVCKSNFTSLNHSLKGQVD